VVGHPYGWLRNGSTAATSARWLPDLSTGWEYRPLIRGWEGLGEGQECWLSDDGTLRIEALRGRYMEIELHFSLSNLSLDLLKLDFSI
jgi:hypothetical protein